MNLRGVEALFASRKGTVFGGTSAIVLGLMGDGALPVPLGSKMLVLLACVHMLGQGIADFGRGPERQ